MLTAVSGYYNGECIVPDERIDLAVGQRVIITILDTIPAKKKKVDLRRYMGRGEKMFPNGADEYVEGLRKNDRV